MASSYTEFYIGGNCCDSATSRQPSRAVVRRLQSSRSSRDTATGRRPGVFFERYTDIMIKASLLLMVELPDVVCERREIALMAQEMKLLMQMVRRVSYQPRRWQGA